MRGERWDHMLAAFDRVGESPTDSEGTSVYYLAEELESVAHSSQL